MLACNIFSKKYWILCSDKYQVQKLVTQWASYFCTIKKKIKIKKNRRRQTHSWTHPPLHPFQGYLSLVVCCVCVLFIYTIFISIICVSQEELSLTAYNQLIYDFYTWVIFVKKTDCGKQIFDVSENFGVIQIAAVSTWQVVLMYVYMAVSDYWSHCVSLWACAWVILNKSTSKKSHYESDLSKIEAMLQKAQSKVFLVLRYQRSTGLDRYH